jgi:large subunit ribosomal protein L32e
MKEWIKMTTEKKDVAVSVQNALKIRARSKSKKPAFVRPESWRYDKFAVSWRRPRGLDNKVRRKIKGWPPSPSAGYKGPKLARGLHPSGCEEVLVHNLAEIAVLNPDLQVARIAHTVGMRKRAEIIAEAQKLNLTVVNAAASVKEAPAEEEKKTEAEVKAEEKKEAAKKEKKKKELAKKKKEAKKKEKKKGDKKQ